MRNPIRMKNAKPRFWPAYGAGALALFLARPSVASVLVGLPIILLGVAIRSWGAGHLVKNDRLTTSGPYAWVRHPLYLGTLLVGLGFACMLGGASAAASATIIVPWFFFSYFPRKDRVESERLRARYGGTYDRYRAEVSALWPSLSAWKPALGDDHEESGLDRVWSPARYDDNNELGTLIAILVGAVVVGSLALTGA